MMSNYDIVKERVDIVDAAEKLGISVNRSRRALCPFHNDVNNPGLKFYDNSFVCFTCGVYGDVINLVSRKENLLPNEALAWINATYNLGLKLDEEVDYQLIQQINMEREHRKEIKKLVDLAARSYCSYCWTLREWRAKYAPRSSDEELDRRFVASLTQLDYIEYICDDVFLHGDYDKRRKFVLREKKNMAKIIQILKDGDNTGKDEKTA